MKKFFFRLETLLRVRRAHEGTLKRDLEHASQKWNRVKEQEKVLQNQIGLLLEEMRTKGVERRLNLQETYSKIAEHLNSSLAQVQQNMSTQQRVLEEQKERLRQAIQARKIIEKIKEKHYADWRIRESQSEGALLDEIALKKPIDFK